MPLRPLLSLDAINGQSVDQLGFLNAIEKIRSTRPLRLSFAEKLDSGDLTALERSMAEDTHVRKPTKKLTAEDRLSVTVQNGRLAKLNEAVRRGQADSIDRKQTSVLFVLPGPLGLKFTEAADGPAAVLRDTTPGSPGAANPELKPGMRLVAYRVGNSPICDVPRKARSLAAVIAQLRAAKRPLLLTFEESSRLVALHQTGEAVLALQVADEAQVMRTDVPLHRTALRSADIRRMQQADEAEIVVATQIADEQAVQNALSLSLQARRHTELSAETVREQHQQEEADVDGARWGHSVEHLPRKVVLPTASSAAQAGQPEAIE